MEHHIFDRFVNHLSNRDIRCFDTSGLSSNLIMNIYLSPNSVNSICVYVSEFQLNLFY